MENVEPKIIEVEKECELDIYANGISMQASQIECLLTFHRDTPSLHEDDVIMRENVVKVRLNPDLAKQLKDMLSPLFEG